MRDWQEDEGKDVTSAFKGITTPVRDLYDEIHKRGWTVNKVKVNGDGNYEAEGKNPHGEKIVKTGPTDATALGNLLIAVMRRETMRQLSKAAAWGKAWDDQLAEIAHAYAEAPVYEPKAAGAWRELAEDMQARAQAIAHQIHVEPTNDPHPYKDINEMIEDVTKKRHIYISKADSDHPLWNSDQVLAYRLCRDVLGHCQVGGDYGWDGENKATAAMMPLLSPNAQKALFTESIGRAAYSYFYRAFGPHKIVFLDKQLQKHQDEENSEGHAGVHPSQSLVPVQLPDLTTQEKASAWDKPSDELDPKLAAYIESAYWHVAPADARNQIMMFGLKPGQGFGDVFMWKDPATAQAYHQRMMAEGRPYDMWEVDDSKVQPRQDNEAFIRTGPVPPTYIKRGSANVTDPNAGWASGVPPLPDNAYLWIRENGIDPLDWQGLRDEAYKLDTGWHKASHPDGKPDLDTQRQAVVNAMRAVLLAPRKNLRWNATHYQHLKSVPAAVSDPLRLWETLENHRNYHNMARGLPDNFHKSSWAEELTQFKQWVKALHPELHDAQVDEHARSELFHMICEEEERITQEDVDHKLTSQEIEQQTHREIKRRLKTVTKPNVNDKTDFPEDGLLFKEANSIMHQPDPGSYGAFLASSIKPLAGIGHHANELLQAAREDVANNKGRGHHWRKAVLNLGIPGIGPKEASFAWLLLQPKTSQLAVFNPQMADILGHRPEELSHRDYFKWERELQAGRDAAGYTHVPLGQFGWGMWDYRRGGNGHHTDHQPLKALNPQPYDQVDWVNRDPKGEGKWKEPYWWKATQEARDAVADDWKHNIELQFPKGQVPFQKVAYKGYGPVESFRHWWEQEAPFGPWNAKRVAEYAVLEKLTKDELKDFIEDHDADIIVPSRFKEELWKYVDRVRPGLRMAEAPAQYSPWYTHPNGEQMVGDPNMTVMQLLRSHGFDTAKAWNMIEEAGKQ